MITRRQLLASTTLGLAGTALPPDLLRDPATAGRRPPNVVVVVVDDLGFGELGAYGQKTIHTPNLDRLAAEGLRFTDAYASAAVCAPSRSALLTGLHAGHGPVRKNARPADTALTDVDTTFAEVLQARGYRTGLFGKWGFGPSRADQPSHPNARGFEEFLGYLTHRQAHDYYPEHLWHDGERIDLPENGGAEVTFAPDLFQERALDFVREHRDEPFLLVLSSNLPHAPSDVPDQGRYADKDWSTADRGHAAQVTRIDRHVGELADELAAQGLLEDTVLLFTSDNGPHEERGVDPDRFGANGPLSGYKRNLYEGGIRVPLIAWAPGRIRPGTTRRITQQTDVLPTLAALAEAPAPRDVDGRSFAALLSPRPARAPEQHHLYFWRLDSGRTPRAQAVDRYRLPQAAEAVRTGRWKAIRWAPGTDRTAPDDAWQVELYDLERDLAERHDVAAEHPRTVARLVRLMRSSWVDAVDREGYGLTVTGAHDLRPGRSHTLTATLTNGSAVPWTAPQLTLRRPSGWSAVQVSTRGPRRLGPGDRLTTVWRLHVPQEPGPDAVELSFAAEAVADGVRLAFHPTRVTGPWHTGGHDSPGHAPGFRHDLGGTRRTA